MDLGRQQQTGKMWQNIIISFCSTRSHQFQQNNSSFEGWQIRRYKYNVIYSERSSNGRIYWCRQMWSRHRSHRILFRLGRPSLFEAYLGSDACIQFRSQCARCAWSCTSNIALFICWRRRCRHHRLVHTRRTSIINLSTASAHQFS